MVSSWVRFRIQQKLTEHMFNGMKPDFGGLEVGVTTRGRTSSCTTRLQIDKSDGN